MLRKTVAAVFGVLVVVGNLSAQVPARLRWQAGQVLLYKVEQAIAVTEIVGDNKVETSIKVNNTQRRQVLSVDADGVATVQHSLVALRQESTASGKTLLFDSADPDKSSPELREALSKYVGAPLAVLRVDGLGRVVEVKESKFGPAHRYEAELPFVGVLPADGLRAGQTWDRSYQLTLEKDKYAAAQHFVCKNASAGTATVVLGTEVKQQPEAVADRVTLLYMQPDGEIVYDLANGRLSAATLKIDKELKGFQGEGSSIRVNGTYVERYVGER